MKWNKPWKLPDSPCSLADEHNRFVHTKQRLEGPANNFKNIEKNIFAIPLKYGLNQTMSTVIRDSRKSHTSSGFSQGNISRQHEHVLARISHCEIDNEITLSYVNASLSEGKMNKNNEILTEYVCSASTVCLGSCGKITANRSLILLRNLEWESFKSHNEISHNIHVKIISF